MCAARAQSCCACCGHSSQPMAWQGSCHAAQAMSAATTLHSETGYRVSAAPRAQNCWACCGWRSRPRSRRWRSWRWTCCRSWWRTGTWPARCTPSRTAASRPAAAGGPWAGGHAAPARRTWRSSRPPPSTPRPCRRRCGAGRGRPALLAWLGTLVALRDLLQQGPFLMRVWQVASKPCTCKGLFKLSETVMRIFSA